MTVYAEGMPYDTTDEALRAFFEPCGGLVGIKAPRWQDSGRLRGYAHVTFSSAEGVAAALALSNEYLGDRFIKVSSAKALGAGRGPPPSTTAPSGCTTLFVRNLPYDADEEAIKAVFSKFGALQAVRLVRRSDTHASKGFCYVQYGGKGGAEAAVAAAYDTSGRGLMVGGRAVQLDYDTSSGPKASFKDEHGRRVVKDEGGGSGSGGGGGGGGGGGRFPPSKDAPGKKGGKKKRVDAGVAAHSS